MSESEKFEAQGRAHAALKQARSNVATIAVRLGEYGRRFSELSRLLSQFISDPNQTGTGFNPPVGHLKQTLQQVQIEAVIKLIDELQTESSRAAEIQAKIDDF